MEKIKAWAKKLKRQIFILYFAYRDERVPWYVKLFTACIVAYAFSPIDLIPDFIPILGYLDDVIILPLGIMFALKMIPKDVIADCEVKANEMMKNPHDRVHPAPHAAAHDFRRWRGHHRPARDAGSPTPTSKRSICASGRPRAWPSSTTTAPSGKGRIRIDGLTYGGFKKENDEPAERLMRLIRSRFSGEIIEYAPLAADADARTPGRRDSRPET